MSGDTIFVMAFAVVASAQRLWETFKRRPTISGSRLLRWSFPAMMVIHAAIFLGSMAEYYYVRRELIYWVTGIGLALYVSSIAIRAIAIRSLGKFWSLHIEIRQEHQLVTQGIYSVVRHPAYVSVILELLSVPFVMNSYYTTLVTLFVYLPLLWVRLSAEESALVEKFGDRYRVYQREVGRLMPRPSALWRARDGEQRSLP